MSTYVLGLSFLLLATFILAALAAAAETALTSVSRLQVRRLVESGDKRAVAIQHLHSQPNDYLTAILTFNTIAIVISATAADLLAAHLGFDGFIQQLLVGLIDAIVVLLFAEITAKSLALRSNVRVALVAAQPVAAITRVLRPALHAMSAFPRLLSGGSAVRGPYLTEEELKLLVTVGEEEGVIEEEEREMIHGIIEIGDMNVREVMVPRIDIIAVEVHEPVSEVINLILKHGHTRIPVYEKTIDRIVGVAYAKDLLRVRPDRGNGDLRATMRAAHFVPENKNLSEFLHDMREKRVHMAIVVDEFGQTAGLVTIEDVIEEIVGPIRDEYDTLEEEEVQFLAPNEVLMDARVSLADARDILGLDLEAEDVDSIGGFIYSHLGTIPKRGQVIQLGEVMITVVGVRGQRIGKLRVRSEHPFPGATESSAAAP